MRNSGASSTTRRRATIDSSRAFCQSQATSGGTASINSFMLQVPKPTRGNAPDGASTLSRGTMVHEMIHGWVGGISGSGNTQWFGEGATTYFTARTELELSLMPLEALAREYTNLSRDYYPNPYRNVSADSASGMFWFSKEGERIPYARGSLYFMDLNARIKKASAGRRSLDDVMFALFAKRAANGPLTTDAFLAAVAGELGPARRPNSTRSLCAGRRRSFSLRTRLVRVSRGGRRRCRFPTSFIAATKLGAS